MSDGAPAQFLGLASTHKWSELQSLMVEMGNAAPYWRTQSIEGVLDLTPRNKEMPEEAYYDEVYAGEKREHAPDARAGFFSAAPRVT